MTQMKFRLRVLCTRFQKIRENRGQPSDDQLLNCDSFMEFLICSDITEYPGPNYDLSFAGENNV